jgi:hypothetical protein
MEHQIEITVTEHGRDPEHGDQLLGAFHEIEPGADAVMDQDVNAGTLTATFIISADEVEEAVRRGFELFAAAAMQADLTPTRVLAVHGEACPTPEATENELLPVG